MLREARSPPSTAAPAVLPRLAISLAPILAALTFGFALYYGYGVVLAVRAGNWPFAVLHLVLGFGGVALGVALLQNYRRIRTAVRHRRDG
jgi:hypothetical protein